MCVNNPTAKAEGFGEDGEECAGKDPVTCDGAPDFLKRFLYRY